ncbi:MAG: hypothetical protein OQK73_11675 [Gammaproteobacteria bacterium]|nr:hypothetical protein [Gammaproteobacteria bacterium]
MPDRRMYVRKLADAKVRIYHSAFGSLEGRIQDISEASCSIVLVDVCESIHDAGQDEEEFITLKPTNMDVVFKMRLIRRHEDGVVLKFEECKEGAVNADAL